MLKSIWKNRAYGVAIAGCIVIALGVSNLVQQDAIIGWLEIVGGTVLVAGTIINFVLEGRRSARRRGQGETGR
ncbi:hypothetical protein HDA32_002662 [Spinactinospora alkalitolerans]|uniref:Uncharacterized protein n=1 Tax=Spinactinospora alkalitolerans TaxID=687207 RepID=A0A852TXA4_9ACTN|nr:hypothetical protein [Spinactinospora alkalitolerans]